MKERLQYNLGLALAALVAAGALAGAATAAAGCLVDWARGRRT